MLCNGNKVAFLNVLCTGNDLNAFTFAQIHLANPHMVGVGVAGDRENLTHNNIYDFFACECSAFNLGAGEGHSLGKVFVACVNTDEFIKPFSAEIHISHSPFFRTVPGNEHRFRR